MFEIADQDVFGKVIAEEVSAVDGNSSLTSFEKIRFVNALAKAAVRIEQDGAWMTYEKEDDTLLIWSSGSNQIYTVDGSTKSCQCLAGQNGNVCWHRAALRLISRYLLAETVEAEIEYMKSQGWSVAGRIAEVAK